MTTLPLPFLSDEDVMHLRKKLMAKIQSYLLERMMNDPNDHHERWNNGCITIEPCAHDPFYACCYWGDGYRLLDVWVSRIHSNGRTNTLCDLHCIIRTRQVGHPPLNMVVYAEVPPHLPNVTDALERMWREDPDTWLPFLKQDEHAPQPAP